MQYGMKRIMNNWQKLKQEHPDQINAVTITDADGNEQTSMHVRTKLFTHLIRNKSIKYRFFFFSLEVFDFQRIFNIFLKI